MQMNPTTAIQGHQARGRLSRTAFATSRLLDFSSEKELTAQTGHDREDRPVVALKERLDRTLDAGEAGRPVRPPDRTAGLRSWPRRDPVRRIGRKHSVRIILPDQDDRLV